MIYLLEWGTWDGFSHYILEGPEVENWEAYCISLIPEAVEKAILNTANDWKITWREITESVCNVLCERGYRRIRPITAQFIGDQIEEEHREGEPPLFQDLRRTVIDENERRDRDLQARLRNS